MVAGEAEFVTKRIYLPLERARDIAVRNVFRKVFLAGGYDPATASVSGPGSVNGGCDQQQPLRRTRVPINEFVAAMRLSTTKDDGEGGGQQQKSTAENDQGKEKEKDKEKDKAKIDRDEVECFLANLIYKVGGLSRFRTCLFLSLPKCGLGGVMYG